MNYIHLSAQETAFLVPLYSIRKLHRNVYQIKFIKLLLKAFNKMKFDSFIHLFDVEYSRELNE